MAQPQKFERQHDFTLDEPSNVDVASLNTELDNVALTTNQIRENLALMQEDDGTLRRGIVSKDALGSDVLAEMEGIVTDAQKIATEAADRAAKTSADFENTAAERLSDVNAAGEKWVDAVSSEGLGQKKLIQLTADILMPAKEAVNRLGTEETTAALNRLNAGSTADNIDVAVTHASEIDTVSGSIASVNTVSGSISAVQTVSADISGADSSVKVVASNIGSVNTVSRSIANVNSTGSNIEAINTVAEMGFSAHAMTLPAGYEATASGRVTYVDGKKVYSLSLGVPAGAAGYNDFDQGGDGVVRLKPLAQIDTELSTTSSKPVQNAAIAIALNAKVSNADFSAYKTDVNSGLSTLSSSLSSSVSEINSALEEKFDKSGGTVSGGVTLKGLLNTREYIYATRGIVVNYGRGIHFGVLASSLNSFVSMTAYERGVLELTGKLKTSNGLAVTGAASISGAVTMSSSLSVAGNVSVSGALTCSSAIKGATLQATSDIRLKKDLEEVEVADLSSLHAYTYTLRQDGKRHIGLIAQQVKEEYPEAVSEGADGFLSLDYNSVVALLVAKVNELEKRLEKVES